MPFKRHTPSRFFITTVASLFLIAAHASADDPAYTVIDIGAFTPDESGAPHVCGKYGYLSNNGEFAYNRGYRAKKYSVSVGEQDLGGLFDGEAVSYSLVTGIDDNGVVYGYSTHLVNVSLKNAATVFNNGTVQNISIASPSGVEEASPSAASNSGRKLRAIGTIAASNTPTIFLWEDLVGSTAAGDFENPIACAVNNNGDFVGSGSSNNAALHSADGTITLFSTTDFNCFPGGCAALAIANNGQILISTASGGYNDRTWIVDGADRTQLTGFQYAKGMNNFGEVVGIGPTVDGSKAVLYKGGQYYNLDDMIDPGLGIHLGLPYAINDSRQIVISGTGPDNLAHTYLLTESIPEYQPDLTFGAGASATGQHIYSTNGDSQSSSFTLKKGKSKVLKLQLINGGKSSDTIKLKGSGSNKRFTIQYLLGKTDITPAVKSGNYKFAKLAPQATKTIKVKITALSKGEKTSTFTLAAKSTTDTTRLDVVKIVATQSK